jgi:fumarate reductase subunit C
VVRAIDNYGAILNDVDFEIAGPEGTLSGTITGDSLVILNQPYGAYQGTAWYEDLEPSNEFDTLDMNDHDMLFHFIWVGTGENALSSFKLSVSPNPSSGNVLVNFELEVPYIITINLISLNGQLIRTLADQKFAAGVHQLQWDGNDGSGQAVAAGAYTVVMKTSQRIAAKVIIRR